MHIVGLLFALFLVGCLSPVAAFMLVVIGAWTWYSITRPVPPIETMHHHEVTTPKVPEVVAWLVIVGTVLAFGSLFLVK